MNQKTKITRYLIEKLNLKAPTEKSFKEWIYAIWQNPRQKDHGGLWLTQQGFELLCKAELKFYEVKLEDVDLQVDNKFILWLDNTFNCPFYISNTKIFFFNEKPAVQLVLFSGNLQKYFQAHQNFSNKLLSS
jgi:hypothetical protein